MSDLPTGLLCLPAPGDATVRRLQHKVRLIALRALLQASAHGIGPRAGASLQHLQAVIQSMVRAHKSVVLDAVGAPDVLNPLLVMATGMRAPEPILLRVVPALLCALSVHSRRVPEAVLWEADVDVLPCAPGGWRLALAPSAKALLLDPTGLTIELHDGVRVRVPDEATLPHSSMAFSHPFHEILGGAGGLRLSLHDSNPLAMEEAHPDKSGNAVTLGSASGEEWLQALREAVDIIGLALPAWRDEMSNSLRRILPVGVEPEMHLSASYREAPEVIYMTLHPDPLTMAEAIIHETQHSKCNLLSWLDPVLHNAYTTWTDSPVRPDLRPLMGVLLAVHAFTPVAALHLRLAELDHPLSRTKKFEDRRRQVLAGNAGGLKVVQEKAKPSASGAKLIEGLVALHEHVAGKASDSQWAKDALPPG